MSKPSPPPIHSYLCVLLNSELKAMRTVAFDACTDDEAIETAAELLRAWRGGLPLAGFELRKAAEFVMVPLEHASKPFKRGGEEKALQHSQAS